MAGGDGRHEFDDDDRLGARRDELRDLQRVHMRRTSCAESCTGGLLAATLVDIEGSGDWFVGGLVAYDAKIKFDQLGVNPGPVVTATAAEQMAIGALRRFGTDLALATTGVAGPATEEDVPVGTVFIAVARRAGMAARNSAGDGVRSVCHRFPGDPRAVRRAAVGAALRTLRDALADVSPPAPRPS
jgi:nicotinamide-nucleotide amidase